MLRVWPGTGLIAMNHVCGITMALCDSQQKLTRDMVKHVQEHVDKKDTKVMPHMKLITLARPYRSHGFVSPWSVRPQHDITRSSCGQWGANWHCYPEEHTLDKQLPLAPEKLKVNWLMIKLESEGNTIRK